MLSAYVLAMLYVSTQKPIGIVRLVLPYELLHEIFAFVKTQAQISFAVTAPLFSLHTSTIPALLTH